MVEDELRQQEIARASRAAAAELRESLSPPRSIPVTIHSPVSPATPPRPPICVPSRERLSLRHDDGDWEERTHDALEDARPCGGAMSIEPSASHSSPSACAVDRNHVRRARGGGAPGLDLVKCATPRQLPPPRANVKTGTSPCATAAPSPATAPLTPQSTGFRSPRRVKWTEEEQGQWEGPAAAPHTGSGLILSELRPVGTYDTFMV